MICSSSTIFRRNSRFLAVLCAVVALSGLTGAGHGEPTRAETLVAEAKSRLQHGDGISAEIRLKQAIDAGARREDVAAYMGEAMLMQGQGGRARQWLAPRQFSSATAAAGFRALARLEKNDGNLRAAGAALDGALGVEPRNAELWVEVARLRYAGGEHLLSIEAADHALELDPRNVRALEFRGQLVRDRYGLAGALPWFESALALAPDDMDLLGEYAATLGDLGRAKDMLIVTRRILKLDSRNSRAFYLQAVMAARAGDFALARKLLRRTSHDFRETPGALLLEGIVEIDAGNYTLAIEALDRLTKRQPYNLRARDLLARALFLAGEYKYLVERFQADAEAPEASAYLQTVVARAWENIGRRDLAGILLDRAAEVRNRPVHPFAGRGEIAALAMQGAIADASAAAEQAVARDPGFFNNLALAGDMALLRGDPVAASAHYERAARIRMPESLMARRFQAYLMAGRVGDATDLVDAYVMQNPTNATALRLSAWLSVQSGDWLRARRIYEYLARNGSGRDVQLLSDLALTQIRTGDAVAAEETARRAYRLQRSSPVATQAWGVSLTALGQSRPTAQALLDKARAIMGDNPLLAEARLRLAGVNEG